MYMHGEKTMNKILQLLMYAVIVSGLVLPVARAESGGALPSDIANFGIIDDIRVKNMEIVIDDSLLKLSPSTKIKTFTGAAAPISLARKGGKVAFSVNRPARGYPTIIELWLLPANYKFQ